MFRFSQIIVDLPVSVVVDVPVSVLVNHIYTPLLSFATHLGSRNAIYSTECNLCSSQLHLYLPVEWAPHVGGINVIKRYGL